MNNKKCSYYQEQIMLKFYKENFDETITAHLKNCIECQNFEKDLNKKLNFNFEDFEFETVKKKINRKGGFDYFNFKYFKYIAAAVFLLLLIPVIFFQNNKVKTLNKTVITGAQFDLTAVKKNKGGDKAKISYTAFSDMESEITDLKSDMDNFITNIFTEVNYNEEI